MKTASGSSGHKLSGEPNIRLVSQSGGVEDLAIAANALADTDAIRAAAAAALLTRINGNEQQYAVYCRFDFAHQGSGRTGDCSTLQDYSGGCWCSVKSYTIIPKIIFFLIINFWCINLNFFVIYYFESI